MISEGLPKRQPKDIRTKKNNDDFTGAVTLYIWRRDWELKENPHD